MRRSWASNVTCRGLLGAGGVAAMVGLAALLAHGPHQGLWASAGSSAVPPHVIALTYRATIQDLPRDARRVRVWVPLATSHDGQEVLRREVRAPAPYTIAQEPVYHNELLHVPALPSVSGPLTIQVDYELRLGRVMEEPPLSPSELERELRAQGLLVIDDEVRARARGATGGRTTPIDQARGIYDYVIRHMRYEKTTPGWGRGDTRRACQLLRGNCTDFHSLFISMARAQGIPARFKMGLLVPDEPSGTIVGYHCWAEFYTKDRGWVPVDASEAWKHPERTEQYFGTRLPDRVLISVGRDIELVPPQEGAPVNILFSPYVEVDGQPFPHVRTDVRVGHTFRFVPRPARDDV